MKLFFGFDISTQGAGSYTGGGGNWLHLCKPAGLYTAKGYDTLSQSVEAYSGMANGNNAEGLGNWGESTGAAITAGTRTAANTAKCGQLAMVRSSFGIGSEVFYSADIRFYAAATTSYTSAYSSSADYHQIFKWGDVSVRTKTVTWNGVNYDIVLSVYNVSTEVATVTFQTLTTDFNFIKINVVLDATVGKIAVTVNGNAQSVAYTGQNTVSTTSLASAAVIYFGTPAMDNGTILFLGGLDNCYFDDVAFATGRPLARKLTLSGESATGWAATGTSVTTIRDALTSDSTGTSTNNAKAARGTDAGSDVVFTFTNPTVSDCDSTVLGVQIGVAGVHNRSVGTARKLSVGVQWNAVNNQGATVASQALPFGDNATPPSAVQNQFLELITNKPSGGAAYTKTELTDGTFKLRLLVN